MSSHSKDCKYTLEKNELVVGMQTFNNIMQVYSISRGSNCFFSRKIAISNLYLQMPKEIKDVREFITAARRKDASMIKIKKNKSGETKFKVRCSKYLYTLVVKDANKAEKLAKTLPPGIMLKKIDN
ncbi:uncharacterized protein [Blastocystis hominis]|uniref:Ribosomal protein L38e n=1 Tax=Blastocystis hominis TaxID=12968 RepID=D8LW90_BLAHO|nr:uncharacterized protein [Blastocystis hominis]CBK20079.2 unnamed protein product [Blastocystis hominis]|eukprot:XP_012894127.1 uncharacterized protein [Blastocystis hominis]